MLLGGLMPQYHWKGVDHNGQVLIGVLQGRTRHLVRQHLVSQRIIPVCVKRDFFKSAFLKRTWIVMFTQQLTVLLRASVSLEQALRVLRQSESRAIVRDFLLQLQQKIQSGYSLADALRAFPRYFSGQYCAFIAAGETAGRLPETLQRLLVLLQARKARRSQLEKALGYPLFLLTCVLLITGGMLFFVVPVYRNFFVDMGGQLPPLTKTVLLLSDWFRQHGILLLVLFALLGAAVSIAIKHNAIRKIRDRCFLQIPWIGKLVLTATLAHWSYLLGVALTAGIPVLEAVALANASIRNTFLLERFTQLPQVLAFGQSFTEALKKTGVFCPAMLQLVLVGENSGTMPEIFCRVAENYQAVSSESLAKLTKRVEPLAILLLAALVGLVIAALYLPMINLGLDLT